MFKLKLNDPQFLPHCGCNIELLLERKEALTIIGENGLGKTTLVHRFYSLHSDIMSIIEQNSMDQFYDRSLKKLKVIFLQSSIGRINKDFFEHCWNSFGLDKKEDRMLSSLSGGEGQALKLCLGLAPESQVYVLDEPSQYLDESMKKVLNTLLMELLSRQKAVLMIEHDLNWQMFPMKMVELKNREGTLVKGKVWNT